MEWCYSIIECTLIKRTILLDSQLNMLRYMEFNVIVNKKNKKLKYVLLKSNVAMGGMVYVQVDGHTISLFCVYNKWAFFL